MRSQSKPTDRIPGLHSKNQYRPPASSTITGAEPEVELLNETHTQRFDIRRKLDEFVGEIRDRSLTPVCNCFWS